jgi:hypothetical protein
MSTFLRELNTAKSCIHTGEGEGREREPCCNGDGPTLSSTYVHHALDSACYMRMSVTGTSCENAGLFLLMEVTGPSGLLQ